MGKNKLIQHEKLPIFYNPFSRRLFLGTGSSFIALPFISALLPRVAWAAGESEAAYRKAAFLVNRHGGHWLDAHPQGVDYQDNGGFKVGNLKNGDLGPIYNNDYQNLASKVSVLMGLDAAGGCNHVTATALAASFSNFREKQQDLNEKSSTNPESIDMLIAKKIYSPSHAVKVLRLGGSHSFSGQKMVGGISNAAAYDLIMGNLDIPTTPPSPGTPPPTPEPDVENLQRRFIMEKALSSLSLTKSWRNISKATRSQINNYQEILAQARDSYKAAAETGTSNVYEVVTPSASCDRLGRPTSSSDTQAKLKASADLMVAALSCGVTRLAYLALPSEHHYVHRVSNASARNTHKTYLRDSVLAVGGYFMRAMDQITEGNGKTLLDNSCVLITSDLGSSKLDNHNGLNMRVLVGGSFNGAFQTGKAIDYQSNYQIVKKSNDNILSRGDGINQDLNGGRPYNELLISIMRGFGLSQPDYMLEGRKGYGHYHYSEIPHSQFMYDRSFRRDLTQAAVNEYMKNVFLPGYNRDSTLPYFYKT